MPAYSEVVDSKNGLSTTCDTHTHQAHICKAVRMRTAEAASGARAAFGGRADLTTQEADDFRREQQGRHQKHCRAGGMPRHCFTSLDNVATQCQRCAAYLPSSRKPGGGVRRQQEAATHAHDAICESAGSCALTVLGHEDAMAALFSEAARWFGEIAGAHIGHCGLLMT